MPYRAFPPLVYDGAKILILGTFPSPLSREKGEYYGNPRNIFWRVVFGAFGKEFNEPDYGEKKKLTRDNGIAVWDVIESCEITGALDKNIREPVYNCALPGFIKDNGIKRVLFNGTASHKLFRRGIGEPGTEFFILPSTSPANAGTSYEKKFEAWKRALS